jgi:hypothetical protein
MELIRTKCSSVGPGGTAPSLPGGEGGSAQNSEPGGELFSKSRTFLPTRFLASRETTSPPGREKSACGLVRR